MSALRKGILAAALVAISLVTASSAMATVRYASPTGVSTGDCSSADPLDPTNPPCDLTSAYSAAANGDEIAVAAGDYTLSPNLIIVKDIDVHGVDGQPLPRIIGNAPNFDIAVNNPGATLRRLMLDYSGTAEALDAVQAQMIEQVVARSSGEFGCIITQSIPLRDSACSATGANGEGLIVETLAGLGNSFTSNLRNVTAVATGTASHGLVVNAPNGAEQIVVAKNVIARGVGSDVEARAGNATSVATATMSTSNYATRTLTGAGVPTITDPATAGNQTAPPLFTDAAAGLFHEALGSPTINAGSVDGLLGTLDFDGDARTLGTAPDIGADEFIPLPVASPPATTPSTTTPTTTAPSTFDLAGAIKRCKKKFPKGPKRKRCIKKARARALAIAGP